MSTEKKKWEGEEKAQRLAAWLEDKQATDVVAMNVSTICPITEFIVVATARGARHAQALADATLDSAGSVGMEYLGMEGYSSADWILMDLNDVVVHIFQEEVRSLYNIEGLWSEGEKLALCVDPGPMTSASTEGEDEQ